MAPLAHPDDHRDEGADPSLQRETRGYVAYWNDAATETIFVYSELLFSLPDVKKALAALESDFRPGLLSPRPTGEGSGVRANKPARDDSADMAASDPNRDRKGAP